MQKQKGLEAFTLIEISIVLIIIGIIAGTIFKGQDLLESARTRATIDEISHIRLALSNYRDTYGYWPGNDPHAATRFGDGVASGDGRGLIRDGESGQVWRHLAAAGLRQTPDIPNARLGGTFQIRSNIPNHPGNWIVLSGGADDALQPILTPKQAQTIEKSGGVVHIREGAGVAPGSCLRDGHLNLKESSAVCVAIIKF